MYEIESVVEQMKKIRIAFATGDGISINRHFGAAERFDIYEVVYGKARARELVDRRTTAKACEGHQHHDGCSAC